MAHFYLYLANIVFVLTLSGLFVYLVGQFALQDGRGFLGLSLHAIGGPLAKAIFGLPFTNATPEAQHLIVLETGPDSALEVGQVLTLRAPITGIGRSSNNHIELNDPLVSRNHIALSYEREAWWIEDLDSQNGTFLYPNSGNSLQVRDKPEKFQVGDVLKIGHTRLRLQE